MELKDVLLSHTNNSVCSLGDSQSHHLFKSSCIITFSLNMPILTDGVIFKEECSPRMTSLGQQYVYHRVELVPVHIVYFRLIYIHKSIHPCDFRLKLHQISKL